MDTAVRELDVCVHLGSRPPVPGPGHPTGRDRGVRVRRRAVRVPGERTGLVPSPRVRRGAPPATTASAVTGPDRAGFDGPFTPRASATRLVPTSQTLVDRPRGGCDEVSPEPFAEPGDRRAACGR